MDDDEFAWSMCTVQAVANGSRTDTLYRFQILTKSADGIGGMHDVNRIVIVDWSSSGATIISADPVEAVARRRPQKSVTFPQILLTPRSSTLLCIGGELWESKSR